jgi:hypothetical protein
MKAFGFVFVAAIMGLFVFGAMTLYDYIGPHATLSYNPYEGNLSMLPTSGAVQFYSHMRYTSSIITYTIENDCSQTKAQEIEAALRIISEDTVLRFMSSDNGEIHYLCSQTAPPSGAEGTFIAGEGGPVKIINTTTFAVILSGQVELYRPETCQTPNIALHETFHALGFDHVNDPTDIMYPVTDCHKVIHQSLIKSINALYAYASEPDLSIETVSANQSGSFLNFHIAMSNHGVRDSLNSTLTLFTDNKKVKDFPLGEIDLGTKKFLDVQNLLIDRSASTIEFTITPQDNQSDMFPNNNFAELDLVYKK